jgi:prevent-host-death family protein
MKKQKRVALSEFKGDLSKLFRMAERMEIVITRHGKPAGVLIGFANDEEWSDYRLERDPRFLKRVATARRNIKAGRGVPLEDV